MDAFEREEQCIEDQLACGEIDTKEYNEQMLELQRDCRAAAEESAQDAYDREMDNW